MSKRQRVECFRASGVKTKTQGKPWAGFFSPFGPRDHVQHLTNQALLVVPSGLGKGQVVGRRSSSSNARSVLLFEVTDPFPNTWISSVFTSETSSFQYCNHPIEVRTPSRIRPYPTGRLFWDGDSQALRARLRSHRPSGTKAIRLWEAALSERL